MLKLEATIFSYQKPPEKEKFWTIDIAALKYKEWNSL